MLNIELDALGLPYRAEVQLRTAIQCDPAFRQSSSTQSGREIRCSFYFYRSRHQCYTQIIVVTLTITHPVEREGIHSSLGEVEGLGSIYNTCDIIGISSRDAIIIRYIERVRTAISYSRTAYPLIDVLTIEGQPAVGLLKVTHIRQLSRSLECLEGLHQRLALLGLATSATNEEDVIRGLSEFAQFGDLVGRVSGVVSIRRRKISSRISYIAVLPRTFLVSIPSDLSRRTGNVTQRDAERTLTSRNQVDSYIRDMEVVVTVSFGGLTVECQHDALTGICAQVELHGLTLCADLVERRTLTLVTPSAKCCPISATVIRDEDDELIVVLLTCGNSCRRGTCIGSQSEIEGQLITSLHLNHRTYQPMLGVRTGNIQIEVLVVEDTVLKAYAPTVLASLQLCTTLLYSLEKRLIAFPLTRHSRGVEGLDERNNRSRLSDDRFTIVGEIFLGTNSCYANLILGECTQACDRIRISCDIQRGPYSRRICCRLVLETPCRFTAVSRPCYRQGCAGSLCIQCMQTGRLQTGRSLVNQYII